MSIQDDIFEVQTFLEESKHGGAVIVRECFDNIYAYLGKVEAKLERAEYLLARLQTGREALKELETYFNIDKSKE